MKYTPLIFQKQIQKMFSEQFIRTSRFWILLIIDVIIVLFCFLGAFFLRFDLSIPIEYHSFLISYVGIILIVKLMTFLTFHLYRGMWRYTSLVDILKIVKASSIASLLSFLAIVLLHGLVGFPRSVLIIDYFLTTVFIGTSRISIRILFTHRLHPVNISLRKYRDKKTRRRLIVMGAGYTSEKIIREIRETSSSKYSVVGLLDDNPSKLGATIHGSPVLGTIKDLLTLKESYDEILICIPSATREEMRRIVALCETTGKRFRTVPAISELIDGEVTLNAIREVSIVDLLGREEITLDRSSIASYLHHKRILVTGAGGSIGSELVRQCLNFQPDSLVLLDISEHNLFRIDSECQRYTNNKKYHTILGDIRDRESIQKIFLSYKPQVVFHAAAYKHVPMQELCPWEAVFTNIQGTLNLIDTTELNQVERFVLVSTDKAVKPTSVMGATKNLAEMLIQAKSINSITAYMAVRFGNVIGSSGSAVPIFQEQIKNGGPITVTHPDMERYFMSISEAAQLIIQAGAIGKGGEIFILDMGNTIKVKDLAYELIRLSGLEPEVDILIEYTGIRPGEKLVEELISDSEEVEQTEHPKIMVLRSHDKYEWRLIKQSVKELISISQSYDEEAIKKTLQKVISDYLPYSFEKA